MTEAEWEQWVRRSRKAIEEADRVLREIRQTLREAERNSAARRERFRRAGILP
jgi:uncharacterized protein YukE